ncbi:MAG: hypothetical protein ACTHMI_24095 [Mucilaginibacter sp.]
MIESLYHHADWEHSATVPVANSTRFITYVPINNPKKNLAFEICINPDSLKICYAYILKIDPGNFPSADYSGIIQRYFLNNTLYQINEYKKGIAVNEQTINIAERWINPFHIFNDDYVLAKRDKQTGNISNTAIGSVNHKMGLTDSISFNGEQGLKTYYRDDVFGRINGKTLSKYLKHPGPGSIGDAGAYFQAFDHQGSQYSIAVFINQPVLHTGLLFNKNNLDVGHNYVALRETDSAGKVTVRYAGFYPLEPSDPVLHVKRPGDLNNDMPTPFTKGFSWQVSKETFFAVLDNIRSYQENKYEYDLFDKNCVNFVFDILKQPCFDLYPLIDIVYYPGQNVSIYHGLSPGLFGEKVDSIKLPSGTMIFPGNRN